MFRRTAPATLGLLNIDSWYVHQPSFMQVVIRTAIARAVTIKLLCQVDCGQVLGIKEILNLGAQNSLVYTLKSIFGLKLPCFFVFTTSRSCNEGLGKQII